MLSRTKIIALPVAALLAVGGGIYAFAPDEPQSPSGTAPALEPAEVAEKPDAVAPQQAQVGHGAAKDPTAVAAQQNPQASVPSQAPKKLTRQQLAPPPLTEAEKLEKAAEQESNF